MATARRVTASVPPPPPDRVQLDLAWVEAETLAAILQRIGGSPLRGRRKHADSIGVALSTAGVKATEAQHDINDGGQRSGIYEIYFNDNPSVVGSI